MTSTPPTLTVRRTPSGSVNNLLFVIGGFNRHSLNVVEAFNSHTDTWFKPLDLQLEVPRCYHGSVNVGTEIYVIGGFSTIETDRSLTGRVATNTCVALNVETKTWRDIPSMTHPRAYLRVVLLGDAIYALGGFKDIDNRHASVEKFDLQDKKWSLVAPMLSVRSDAGAETLNGKIYVVGGFDGEEILATGEVYDPVADQWTEIRAMSSPRTSFGCAVHKGQIYAIGGSVAVARLKTGEKYDPDNDEWKPIADMNTSRSTFGMAVMKNKIMVYGGFDGQEIISEIESYDDQTDKWTKAGEMMTARSALTVCVVPDVPNYSDYVTVSDLKWFGGKTKSTEAVEGSPEKKMRKDSTPTTPVSCCSRRESAKDSCPDPSKPETTTEVKAENEDKSAESETK